MTPLVQQFDSDSMSFDSPDLSHLIAHPDRSRGDMCPGAIALHNAVDGFIGRVRFPGGRIRPQQWKLMADIATDHGDGVIHVTTRGNVQFRGVHDKAAFFDAVDRAGFVPSVAHDKMRNIIASALAPELWPLVEALDTHLRSNGIVAGLSGRTLFGVDSGVGDVLSKKPDFAVVASDAGYHLALAGKITDLAVDGADSAAVVLTDAAQLWQQQRGSSWRLYEKPDVIELIYQNLSHHPDVRHHTRPVVDTSAVTRPIGWLPQPDGTISLGAGLRFGMIPAQVATLVSALDTDVTVTPWPSLMIHHLSEENAEAAIRVLAPLGLIFDSESPWLRVSACTGLPGCARSLSHTRDDATALIESESAPDGLVHFSGCERRCGHPLTSHTEYVAVAEGEYEVTAL